MSNRAGFTLIEVLVTLTVLSIGAMGIMKYTSQTQDMAAEISHIDTMSRLAVMQLNELEKDGFSASMGRDGVFDDYPGYEWSARSHLIRDGGWYRMALTVKRIDTGRTIVVERIFRELL